RDNITTFYGKTSESRIADPDDPSRIFSWLICHSQDDKGNVIVYRYASENSGNIDRLRANERNLSDADRSCERYPKRILYGNFPPLLVEPDVANLSWRFEAVFDYGEGHYAAQPADAQGREYVNATPIADPTKWPARQDPFSRYRAGFGVRTYRLCRRV